jgi:antirestriction protein
MTTTETVTPKVWIGCLAAYNAGHLHGEWVDAAVDEDEIWEAQKRVLKTSPVPGAEEHFIADYEGFGPYRVGEYESLTTVALVARLIEEHGKAFAAWVANDDSVLRDADENDLEEGFHEAYAGTWDSERAFAENATEELGLPGVGVVYKPKQGSYGHEFEPAMDEISSYLDWDAITRAQLEDCWTSEDGGEVHVFRSY